MCRRKTEPEVLTTYEQYQRACRIAQGLADTPAQEYAITCGLLKFHPEALGYAVRAEQLRVTCRMVSVEAALSD